MPKLPSFQDVDNVSPTIQRDPGVRAPVEAFQSGSGVIAKELAPGIRAVADVVKEEEHRIDNASVNDARRKLLEFETEQTAWLSQQKGENVFNAKAALAKASDNRLAQIRGQLTNDQQLRAFKEIEGDWRTSFNRTASLHIAAEMDRHYDNVDNKLIETSSRAAQKAASSGDYDRVQQEWSDQEKVIAGVSGRKGLSPNEQKAMLDGRKSNFHSGIAQQLVADGNDGAAQKYLDANKDEFDADDRLKLENLLKTRQNEKSSEYRVAIADKMQDVEAMGARGVIPPKNFISDQEIDAAYPKDPARAAQLKRRRDESVRFAVGASTLFQRNNEDLIKFVKEDNAPSTLRPENFAEEARHQDLLKAQAVNILKQRHDAPIEYAAANGIGAVNPIDFGDPASISAEIPNRARTAKLMSDQFGSPPMLLTKGEAEGLSSALKQKNAQQKLDVFGNLYSSTGENISAYQSVMAQIAPDDPVTAIAGVYTARGRTEASKLMLQGQELLRPPSKEDGKPDKGKLWPMPPDTDLRKNFASYERDAFAGHPRAQSDFYQAAMSIYAAKSADAGDASGVLNTDRWQESIKLATGGIEKWNGKSTLMPYGMSRGDFKDGLYRRIDDAVALNKSDKGDKNLSASDLRNMPLEPIGDGRYVFRSGDGIMVGKNNKPIVIDFNTKPMGLVGAQ